MDGAAARRQECLDAVNSELNQLRQETIIKSKSNFILPPSVPEILIFEREYVFQRIIEREMSFADADKIIVHAWFGLRCGSKAESSTLIIPQTDLLSCGLMEQSTLWDIWTLAEKADGGGKKYGF